jgi:transcription elongation factor GreA
MSTVSYLTEEGFLKLKEELERLKSVERPAISHMIADAREKGDLSENAEYHAAKEAQEMLERRIAKLENTISKSRIIDNSKVNTSTVQLLSKIKIKNKATNMVMEYIIVSENEADLKAGKISVTSPIAKGLLGKKPGDVVEIAVPSGRIHLEILSITK